MEAKIVVGTKSGKSFNIEAKGDLAAVFMGKRIGDVVSLTHLGLKGYDAKISGGSDKCGFPMRKDAHVTGRTKALLSTRTAGYKPRGEGVRMRRTVVGDIINDAISQINVVVVKEGHDSIEKLLGLDKTADSGPKTDAAAPAAEHAKAEHKPAEHKPEHKAEPAKEHKPEHKEAPKAEHKAEAHKPADEKK